MQCEFLMRKRLMTVNNGISLQKSLYNYWIGEVVDSTIYSYEFDEKGNWTRKVDANNN